MAAWLLLVAAACGTNPTAPPTGTAAPLPSAPRISDAEIAGHVAALDEIAAANGGSRTVGSAGYTASVDYVVAELEAMGYTVSTPTTEMTLFEELPGATVKVRGGPTFRGGPDFRAMIYSDGGDVTARLVTIGFPDSPGGEGARGCEADDFAEFPRGKIAVVAPGAPCLRRVVVMNAEEAGAAALIAPNPAWPRDEVLRPTLFFPNVTIPVLAASSSMGEELLDAAGAGTRVRLSVQVSTEPAAVQSVVAETSDGNPARVVMLGAHLDSVHDGPGINDNGSGVAAVLAIARSAADGIEGGRLRFGFWAGEEYGLYGSRAYVESLSVEDRQAMAAYLNLDMLGTQNEVPFVYEEARAAAGSEAISDFLVRALDAAGIGSLPIDVGGASDHGAFQDAGIPTGGLFSGASEPKTDEQREQFGGTAGQPMDACYHLSCDTAANVDPALVARLAAIAATAAQAIARGDLLP